MKTATRTVAVFEAFAECRRPLTLTELAHALRVPISSCFGLVRALENRGYLHSTNAQKALYPTRRMLQTAQIISAHEPVVARLTPQLARLRDKTRETVILGQMHASGSKVIYLDILEGPQTVRYTAGIGDLKPLHSSAIGKALLATLPAARLDALLKKLQLTRVTAQTLTTIDALKADLEAGRTRGYQMTRGENVADVAAIALAVTVSGRTFGVAVAGPIHRMDAEIAHYAEALRATCRALEGDG